MIEVRVTGQAAALRRLKELGDGFAANVERTVLGFALDVTALAKRGSPLKTGRLRRSIHQEVRREADRIVGTVGTNVVYAAQFEYGFKGMSPVRSFVRKQTMAWGRPITPAAVTVRAHSRSVNRPARPFLAPALDGVTPNLAERLRADLRAAVRGAGA